MIREENQNSPPQDYGQDVQADVEQNLSSSDDTKPACSKTIENHFEGNEIRYEIPGVKRSVKMWTINFIDYFSKNTVMRLLRFLKV